ncbi:MAG: ABC transporter permease, partial [Solirubrobacteraceae bacterium]
MSLTERGVAQQGPPMETPGERVARLSAEAAAEERPYMRPYALFFVYRARVRVQGAQELLAGVGVAIAVALIFAVLVSSQSIAGSAGEVIHRVVGPAQLQLRALGPQGIEERLLGLVERLPGVKQAAPVLEVPAQVEGPSGKRVNVQLLGGDIALATLDGLAHTLPGSVFSERAIGLSKASATALGVGAKSIGAQGEAPLVVKLRGRAYRLGVSAVIGPEAGGALSQALAAALPIESLQAMSGLNGRVSRILVQAGPGQKDKVQAELTRLAGGRMAVAPSDQDLTLLKQALTPSNQATELFALIAALLGFLFAFNAFLLTVPERRMAIADMRLDGTRRPAIVEMILFEALVLGALSSVVGLAIGYALARGVFHSSTAYLAQAFVLGGQTVVGVLPALLAFGAGIVSACAAAAILLTDLRRGRPVDAVYSEQGEPGHALSRALMRKLSTGALTLLLVSSLLFALLPQAALVACVMLALATVLGVPALLAGVLRLCDRIIAGSEHLMILPVAVASLRATS